MLIFQLQILIAIIVATASSPLLFDSKPCKMAIQHYEPNSKEEVASILRATTGPVTIRTGGHHTNHKYNCGDTLIDLWKMNHVKWTGDAVSVGPGAFASNVTNLTLQAGRLAIVPTASWVRLGGFISGGGYGFISDIHGWSSDNLEKITVVFANGTIAEISHGHRFKGTWSQFGIVTEFVMRTFPVPSYFPMMNCLAPLSAAEHIAKSLTNVIDGIVQHGIKAMCFFSSPGIYCSFISLQESPDWKEVAGDFARSGQCQNTEYTSIPVEAATQMFDQVSPKGMQNLWRGVFMDDLVGIGTVFSEVFSNSPHSNLGGMLWPTPPSIDPDSPFAAKSGRFYVLLADSVPAGVSISKMRQQFETIWNRLETQQSFTDCYGNEVTDPLPCVYPRSWWSRLQSWKDEMDPQGRFSHNHPIPVEGCPKNCITG